MQKYAGPIAARYGSVVIQFVIVAIVARALSPDAAGQYFVIMGLVMATYFVSGFGLPDGLVRFAPALAATGGESQAAALLGQGFRYSLATMPVGALISGCIVLIHSGSGAPALLAAVWWASCGIIFISAQLLVASGRGQLGAAMFYSAAAIGQFVISVPLIVFGHLDSLDAVLFAIVAGTSVSAAVCLSVTSFSSGRGVVEGGRPPREVWYQGAMIAGGRVVQSCLIWSPVWVVSVTLGASDAALTGLATRLVSAVAAVLAAVRFSIRPLLAHDAAKGNWRAVEIQSSRIALFSTLLAVTAIIIVVTVGDSLIALIFGPTYHGTAGIAALLLIATVGDGFGGPVDEVLRMSGHATEVIVVQTLVLVVAFAAQLFAGHFGGLFAVIGTFSVMYVLLYLVFIIRLWRLRGILIIPRLILRP